MMTQQILDLHVNPSDETICLGPIAIRFLITAEDSGGSVAVFEGTVPAGRAWRRRRTATTITRRRSTSPVG
jgi:hypothetical protein